MFLSYHINRNIYSLINNIINNGSNRKILADIITDIYNTVEINNFEQKKAAIKKSSFAINKLYSKDKKSNKYKIIV